MIVIKYDNYMVRTAQQRDPSTAASAHGDNVYPVSYTHLTLPTKA